MEKITHSFTKILYNDTFKVLSEKTIGGETTYTEIEKLEGENYDFTLKGDIITVKSYKRLQELPEWYKAFNN